MLSVLNRVFFDVAMNERYREVRFICRDQDMLRTLDQLK